MRLRTRFALWLAVWYGGVLLAVGLTAAAFWADLAGWERDTLWPMVEARLTLLVLAALLLPFALAVLLRLWFADYPVAARRLAEEVRVLRTVNPQYRVKAQGGPELAELAGEVNALAEALEALRAGVEERVEESNRRLEREKNRLAALMSELAQSVLVCNAEGRILLYNARATELLGPPDNAQGGSPVGLGRSVFGVLDKGVVEHALEKLRRRLSQPSVHSSAHFITSRGPRLLRAQMAPVLDASGGLDGFVLVLEDVTRMMQLAGRRDVVLQMLTEGTRASLANIRAAVETVREFPQMDAGRRARLIEVIEDEAQRLSERLDETMLHHGETLRAPWPREDMQASDLVLTLQRSVETSLGLTARVAGGGEPLWLSVDSHALVQALTFIAGRVQAHAGVQEVTLELAEQGHHAVLSLRWEGEPLDPAVLHDWEEQPWAPPAEGRPSTLRDVLHRHDGEIWCQSDRLMGVNRISLQLPVTQPDRTAILPTGGEQGRPVYYDFDLFNQPGQTPELDERPLAELSYTVFDTETTGLSPSEGDEIISIGAVRIVNGRLLRQEFYEQLVDPRRPIRKESQAVHGITEQMLAGQPTIDQVLPVFHRFAEDTVLVAHNAAFDMRFLQLKEAATGVRFIQPVLDTLLLSALVHPGHPEEEHRLERIAARLGVPVVGRHTALGDAIVTGEVFLKLLPLLAERGIHTLRQAREASQTTLYAKVRY
ncbi:PAS domain-containing protein [Caldimonas thermodepolymerans]|uniref:DNA-directed DNA polymerase n=1 Tax=Caldimonas thermodepolymerans TaxID=215580 RepID=A0A2S5T379_9BURK|nr:exonuclease domain-containing protein [Caldimonas thermodepolymerans]PPE69440.1 DNA polymerase III subunit epsilon [Caldimonas thermodepolymerans]QPC32791.1 PAS domain-containing protein [Caldimonas thermodepolymerans]RDI03558.1 DNA polymerase-3 subunit epsilon [Caldimonas thermodepolymerans]TCP09468.1 DNA polymerase-3 subunit epsilon [Caldimonas thermodepolymerans]UZG49492.1 exonuclease domain-containing protein [Caldimonas thermodepolymerans]